MGATGAGPFENDDAYDFLDDLEDSEPGERRGKVESALGRVVRADGYIEAPLMAEGIAAAAVVAISDDPEAVGRERAVPPWLLEDPIEVDERLEELASQTLHRALRHDDNEWWELWEEAGSADEVTEVVIRYLDALGD
jgi:Domain of unknown function (DUF4259)